MNKKAYLLGFLSKYRPSKNLSKKAELPVIDPERSAEAVKTRFLTNMGNYRVIADKALEAYRRGIATARDWFGRPTNYKTMGGRDYRHFQKSVSNRNFYNDIDKAIARNSPEYREYISNNTLDNNPYFNPWKFTERFLKGMQPYVDRRTEKIKNDPWSWDPGNRYRLMKHENGDIDGMELLEPMYDAKHEDELQEAAIQAVLPKHVLDTYRKASIWGAFNPVNYRSK